jgi:signal transduction histidine kinase
MTKLPLLWRIFLSTSLVTTLLFALIGYLAHTHALRSTEATLDEELRSSLRAYDALWRSRNEYLASISQLISGLPDVRAAFSTGDRATIRDTAAEVWSRISRSDAVFLVTDPEGNVIASLSGPALHTPEQVAGVKIAAKQFPKQGGGVQFIGDRLFHVAITPVYVHAGGGAGLINVLVAGFPVDDALAESLKASTGGSDVVFLAEGQVVAATMPRDVAFNLGATGRSGRVRQGPETYGVLSTELTDVSGKPAGELRIVRSFTAAARSISDLRFQIAAVWAVAILLALALTFVLARRLLQPIRELDAAAKEVSKGNYDSHIPVKGDDETARVARTFNAMCESIRQSRDELIRQERINTLGRIASSIVHDLRNPLAAIYGGAEMLVDIDNLPASHTKRLSQNIYRASRQVLMLLDDLMALVRGKSPVIEICRMSEIVEDAWSAVASQAEAANVGFQVSGEAALDAPMERARIERVFTNLFANAIQAMPDGGAISVEVAKEHGSAIVTVRDTGPGIPVAIRSKLFQPFTSAGKSNGSGLGLALSRQTVLAHGGDLWLEDGALGACFRLKLPLTRG